MSVVAIGAIIAIHPLRVTRAANELVRSSMLNWVRVSGAESCAGPEEIASKIEARIGHPVFVGPSVSDLAIEAHVEPIANEPGWRVGIVVSQRNGPIIGERNLSSGDADCANIVETSVLVIALMIDPDAVARISAAEEKKHQSRESSSPPSPSSPVISSSDVPAQAVYRNQVDASVTLGVGLLPDPALGISVDWLHTFGSNLGLEVAGAYFSKRGTELKPGMGANFDTLYGTIAGCFRPINKRGFVLAACAGTQIGEMGARGFGLAASNHVTRWLVNPAADGHLDIRLNEHLRLNWVGSVGAPIIRDYFEVGVGTGRQLVYRAAAINAAFQVGLGWAF